MQALYFDRALGRVAPKVAFKIDERIKQYRGAWRVKFDSADSEVFASLDNAERVLCEYDAAA